MRKNILLFFFLVLAASAQYVTNSDRTDSVEDLCSTFSERSELIDDEAEADNDAYMQTLDSQLTTDGYFHMLL